MLCYWRNKLSQYCNTAGWLLLQFYFLPKHTANSNYIPTQYKLTGLHDRRRVCLLRGTSWGFKSNSRYLQSL